jgi:glycosyltransferase involved in cell wall biosynthesis
MTDPSYPHFSLCIPSFNRGNRVLELVKMCLPNLESDWEILVLDNCSVKYTSSYQEIEKLSRSNSRLRYIRHDHNRMVAGNVLACFDFAYSPVIMVISDEDLPNFEFVKYSLELIKSNPDLGLVLGSIVPQEGVTPGNSMNLPTVFFQKGEQALRLYGFFRNYISGGIYNRQKVISLGLQERLRSGLAKHWAYPHLYLEILLAAKCDIQMSNMASCFEGASEPTDVIDLNQGGDYHDFDFKPPYSFGARLDQFVILRDAAYEAVELYNNDFDAELFVDIYLQLFKKYLRLVGQVNAPMYRNNRLFPSFLQASLYQLCRSSIVMYEELRPHLSKVLGYVDEVYEEGRIK